MYREVLFYQPFSHFCHSSLISMAVVLRTVPVPGIFLKTYCLLESHRLKIGVTVQANLACCGLAVKSYRKEPSLPQQILQGLDQFLNQLVLNTTWRANCIAQLHKMRDNEVIKHHLNSYEYS